MAQLDRELLKLLAERRQLAADQAGAGELSPSERLAAEDAAIEALAERATKLPADYVRDVFREVMAGCRVGPRGVRIAYLGPEHTFSHQAAIRRFGAAADLAPVGSIAAVFEEVDRGSSDFGVVPLENSTDGRVTDTLDCFAKTRVTVCGELPLRIHHCLLGSGPRAKLTTVCSKPQALSQCRNWLAQHLPGAEPRPVASTAEAAKMAKEDPAVGAIASASAAGPLGLKMLAENIEDQLDNVTRFAVIGGETPPKTGRDKTSLWLEVPHEPGALADVMAIFKRQKLNLTWIESFPIPGSRGRYLFFVEFLGHQAEVRVRRALESLAKKATQLEVLGSYPQAEPID
ncbi:Prephenate dehydratase [Posidoniimonas polymericola]|uniref:Bifunctional chorismate mutase/prephenate dehydratase n=1 Tax=Posidoniimonas polymericola TaxID=2528002 RepID=A0A5C5YQ80_9BACT|nr:prephenate dehydratase [Posidoniimonas polymericola]TWT76948.1 Prephenate dehydratase [Posidoniimonas polymericola]